jgi:hypothetical protein
LADLDLIVLADGIEQFAADQSWLKELGQPWLVVANRTGIGDPEWLVLFEGGLKADFVLCSLPVSVSLNSWLAEGRYAFVVARGAFVAFDRETGASFRIPPESGKAGQRPGEQATEILDRILMTAAKTLKFIERGDLWRSQQEGLAPVRALVVEFAAIIARQVGPPNLDTWYDGRYLESWCPEDVQRQLPALFARYDRESQIRALETTLTLVIDLIRQMGKNEPNVRILPGQEKTLQWLRERLAGYSW